MLYRPEIDGLRALAVIPVILFHAGLSAFGGGYVGVDIFFVISGYLITTIIINDIEKKNFSIIHFYERRARRILPALFLVMFLCIPFAWVVLSPSDMKNFGQSLVAVSTFSSNILFWQESGYFDTASELKPLLHTWSLAVEEQFYIIFPIFLMFAWRLGVSRMVGILILVFFISLGLAQWGSKEFPVAVFYLLPSRGWELLCGVFAAIYINNKNSRRLKNSYFSQLLSLIGLIMIIYSIFMFDKETPFPSLYALVPTLGTTLIILFAHQKTIVYKVLSLKPIVGLGLISYSAYLWHQPILAFTKYHLGDQYSLYLLLTLCCLSFLFAWFSWKYIEAPFRDKHLFSRSTIFRFSALGMVLFSIIGTTVYFSNGLERLKLLSYSSEERQIYEMVRSSTDYDMYDRMHSTDCKLWAKDINGISIEKFNQCTKKFGSPLIILGDSHAMNLYNIAAKSDNYNFVVGLSQGYCRAHSQKDGCHYKSSADFFKNIANINPTIIYHQAGSYFLNNKNILKDTKDLDYKNISFNAENVYKVSLYLNSLANSGLNVIWLGAFSEYGISPHLYPLQPRKVPVSNLKVFNEIDKRVIKNIGQYDLYSYISFDDFFEITEQVIFDNCLIWRDSNHFSSCGEKLIAQKAQWSIFKTETAD